MKNRDREKTMSPHRRPPDPGITDLVHSESWDRLAPILNSLHPADVADVIDDAPRDTQERLFSMLNDDLKPNVLAELETGTDVLESLTASEISHIVEDMAPDDAADVLGDMPEEQSRRVLELMKCGESQDISKLLEYDEESAGGIMTTDIVAMNEDQTVQEALEAIAYMDEGEPFYHAHIVDPDNKLIGHVDIWELLREKDKARPLGELVHRDFVAASVFMDQEDVAHLISQYDLNVVPVIDARGGLVGRITADDIMDVMEEEASEDILRLAGSDDEELENPSLFKSCAVRLPWLFITLLGGFITSMLLKQFHTRVDNMQMIMLAYFVPIVLAMGGNAGIQSSTLVVRKLALDDLEHRSIFRLLSREILVGIVMGTICGTIITLWARFMIGPDTVVPASRLALVVGIALCSAMTFAVAFGALVPIALDRISIDPAVASGPFVTITNDISALLIYFCITVLLAARLL